jgi:hypothetical protein
MDTLIWSAKFLQYVSHRDQLNFFSLGMEQNQSKFQKLYLSKFFSIFFYKRKKKYDIFFPSMSVYWEDEFNILGIVNDNQSEKNNQQQAFFSKRILDYAFQIFVFDEYLYSLETLSVSNIELKIYFKFY